MCTIHAEFPSGAYKVRGMAYAAKSQILLVAEEKIPAKSVILLQGVVNSYRGMTSRTVLCTHVMQKQQKNRPPTARSSYRSI